MTTDRSADWIPVALSADLPPLTVMPVWLPAVGTVALWRSVEGHVTASADRCPHRGMRLSHGFVRGEALSCIYHGWRYAKNGACLKIPAHPSLTPPPTIRVDAYPVTESDGILWASATDNPLPPPALGNVEPLRSLVVEAPLVALEAAADRHVDRYGLTPTLAELPLLRLLLSAENGARTLMHVLVEKSATKAERIVASRFSETLRRRAERQEMRGRMAG